MVQRCAVHCLGAVILVLALTPAARSEDTAALTQRLEAADAGSALDSSGMQPWHLKMTIQLLDDHGNATDSGTIEEWWNGPDMDRREYKTGGYAATEIRQGRNLYRTEGASSPPYYLELLRAQAVHPMPTSEEE